MLLGLFGTSLAACTTTAALAPVTVAAPSAQPSEDRPHHAVQAHAPVRKPLRPRTTIRKARPVAAQPVKPVEKPAAMPQLRPTLS